MPNLKGVWPKRQATPERIAPSLLWGKSKSSERANQSWQATGERCTHHLRAASSFLVEAEQPQLPQPGMKTGYFELCACPEAEHSCSADWPGGCMEHARYAWPRVLAGGLGASVVFGFFWGRGKAPGGPGQSVNFPSQTGTEHITSSSRWIWPA